MTIGEALWIANADGAAVAHRVLPTGAVRLAEVAGRRQRALPVRRLDRTGDAPVLVPAADVVPAAPLSPAEEREYRLLDAQLAGTIGEAARLKRFNALRLRSVIHPTRGPGVPP